MVYAPHVAQMFERNYVNQVERYEEMGKILLDCTFTDYGTEEGLVEETKEKFDGLINYRMSLGVVYYATMFATKDPDIMSMDYDVNPKEQSWTDRFFTEPYKEHFCKGYEWPHRPRGDDPYRERHEYLLHPVGGQDKSGSVFNEEPGKEHFGYWNNNDGRGWNLEIVLGNSITGAVERHLMIDERIFRDHYPDHTGWVNPDPKGAPGAKRPWTDCWR